jgi:hypothetical protein
MAIEVNHELTLSRNSNADNGPTGFRKTINHCLRDFLPQIYYRPVGQGYRI